MRECAKDLCPDDAEVAQALVIDFGEASIEDVGEGCHAEAGDNGFAALVAGNGKFAGLTSKHLIVAYKWSETQLKVYDTGIWMNSPTAAMALAFNPAKPISLTREGAYVSKPR